MAEPRDWDEFARKLETALDMTNRGGFLELFASGARFADPANAPTEDLRDIQHQTKKVMPDWRQEITSIRGGDNWAFFEWIGYATYRARESGSPGDGTPIKMHGATIIEVDDDGLITSWRDYLDRKEPEDQIKQAVRGERGDR